MVTLAAPRAAEASIYEIQPVPTPVRLIRDVTPSGNIRVLMVALPADLYSLRVGHASISTCERTCPLIRYILVSATRRIRRAKRPAR